MSRFHHLANLESIITIAGLGNQAWTKALAWPGKQEFNDAKLVNFTLPAKAGGVPRQAGQLRSAKGFSFLRVYEAGHMGERKSLRNSRAFALANTRSVLLGVLPVPRDQPEAALAMLNAFISGQI